jgi:hypothetical protein
MSSPRRLLPLAAVATGALGLAGCVAPPPAGPSVMALPGAGKEFQAFQQDDLLCRQYAAGQTGYANPSQAATQSAVGSAVVGTAVGAAAGALIGAAAGNPGAGAAIGAGSGLLVGSAAGVNNAYASAGGVQAGYDIGYAQCMVAHGNTVQPIPTGYAGYPSYYGYGYPYAYPYAYPYPAYAGGAYLAPTVVIGGGWGGGWGWNRGWGGGWRGGGWGGGWRGGGWHR